VKVLTKGSRYSVPTDVVINSISGTGCKARAVLNEGTGSLKEIIIDSPGYNYRADSTEVIITGAGREAVVQPVIDEINGSILSLDIINSGFNYRDGPEIIIEGDGTDAKCHPVVDFETGEIQHVIMTSFGSGYTYANVSVKPGSDPVHDSIRFGETATFRAIIQPPYQHGSNAPDEFFAKSLLINSVITDNEAISILQQDYHHFGILVNPSRIESHNRFMSVDNLVLFRLLVESTTGLSHDDILTHNGFKYRVAGIDNSQNHVYVSQLGSKYMIPDLTETSLFGNETHPNATVNVIKILETPRADRFTGSLMYVSNKKTIAPDSETVLTFKTYINLDINIKDQPDNFGNDVSLVIDTYREDQKLA
jgi:hypothetical protein